MHVPPLFIAGLLVVGVFAFTMAIINGTLNHRAKKRAKEERRNSQR